MEQLENKMLIDDYWESNYEDSEKREEIYSYWEDREWEDKED